jgi:hypothetical protein
MRVASSKVRAHLAANDVQIANMMHETQADSNDDVLT